MIANILSGITQLSDHWAVVLGVSLIFFAVQALLSMKLYAQAWSQERLLRELSRRFERGETGMPALDEPYGDFAWLDWVLSIFPAGGTRPPSNFTRASVLEELDTRIASDSSYLLLQRMGVMAPLMGVVLTVIGFYWLEVDKASEQSLQTILTSVTPLISGVGAGAVLALLNQVMLQAVGGRFERVRMAARTWFDAAIWRHLTFEPASDSKKSIAAMETFASILVNVAQRHTESSDRIQASTASLQQAAGKFAQTVAAIQGEISEIPGALAGIRNAAAASAQALEDFIPAGARAVANLDVSVAAFRTTIDHKFNEAAQIHFDASKLLKASAAHIESATSALNARTDDLNRSTLGTAESLARIDDSLSAAADTLAKTSERVGQTIDSDFGPSQAALHGAASAFADSADKLAGFIEHGIQPATQDLATLHRHLAGLQETIESIQRFSGAREDVDRLTESLSQAAAIADAISSLPEQIRELLEQSMANSNGGYVADRGRRTWICNPR